MNSSSKKSLILIADDNPKNLQLLGSQLRQEGYSVAAALNGLETLTALESLTPDLIMLDVMMPDMDGFEVCQRLKSNERTAQIPVIFITALDETENLVKGFQVGGVDYINKPFIAAELHARVKTHISLKIAQDQLKIQNEQLSQLNSEKNDLLGIVAHDLRNPLTVIRGCAQLLELSPMEESDRELLTKIDTAAERMIELVNNLLDVNSIEQGQMRLAIEAFDMGALAQQIVQNHTFQATTKRINLHFQPSLLSLQTKADSSATMQIMDNLVSNAVKYSPSDRDVFVRLGPRESFIRFEVQDQGPGLSPEDLKKLFGKYARLSAQPTAGEQSVGLGLSIVKKLSESMAGRVWCESELGHGATFILELPAAV